MPSLPREFLKKIALQHQLSEYEQETFLARFSDMRKADIVVAKELNISRDRYSSRMTRVYSKFDIHGSGPKKSYILFLNLLDLYEKEKNEEIPYRKLDKTSTLNRSEIVHRHHTDDKNSPASPIKKSNYVFFSIRENGEVIKYSHLIPLSDNLRYYLPRLENSPFHFIDERELERIIALSYGIKKETKLINRLGNRGFDVASLHAMENLTRSEYIVEFDAEFTHQEALFRILKDSLSSGKILLHLDKCCIKEEDEQYFIEKTQEIANNPLPYLLTSFGDEIINNIKSEFRKKISEETQKWLESRNDFWCLIEGIFNLTFDGDSYYFQLEHPLSQYISSNVIFRFSIEKNNIAPRFHKSYQARVGGSIKVKVLGTCWIEPRGSADETWTIDIFPTAVYG